MPRSSRTTIVLARDVAHCVREAEVAPALVAKPTPVKARKVASTKKARRAVRLAKRSSAKKAVQVASAQKAAPVTVAANTAPVATAAKAPIERWKPTLPPMIAVGDAKPAPDRAPAQADAKPLLASAAPALPASPMAAPKLEAAAAKKQPKLASAGISNTFARHVGLLLMGLGVLVLLCLFFLSKSRRDNEPMDW